MCALKTPLLFLIFNRPKETSRVFEAIRAQRPSRLFVAADGARSDRPDEQALVKETRVIATRVDWPCEVKTLFRDKNLGDGQAACQAISWFFQNVEEGIILEDECLPHPDFFPYCEELLARYRNELRVATIGGTHCLPTILSYAHSHYVSKYFQKGGWATWRRTWQHYDFDLGRLSQNAGSELLAATHPIIAERRYWMEILKSLQTGAIDAWDFQVAFSAWRTGACHVAPGRNLVSILGLGSTDAGPNLPTRMANVLPIQSLVVGNEPVSLSPDPITDNLIFYLRFLGSLTQTYWLEQVLAPDEQLEVARLELAKKNRLVRQLELEVLEKRRELLAATAALAKMGSLKISG